MGELNARTILAGVGLDGIYVKLKDITEQSVATALSLNMFSKNTGLSIVQAQQFGNVVEQMGGNAKEAMGFLAQLHSRLVNLKALGRSDEGLGSALFFLNQKGAGIGRNITDPIAFIEKARKAYQLLTEDQKLVVREALRADQSTVLYLNSSDKKAAEMRKTMAVNEQQIRQLTELGGSWAALSQVMRQLGVDIAIELQPSLLAISNILVKMLTDLERSGVFTKIGEGIREASIWADALRMSLQDIAKIYSNIQGHEDMNSGMKFAGFTGAAGAMAANNMTQSNTINVSVQGAESGASGLAAQIAKEVEQVIKRAFYQRGGPRV